MARIFHGSFGRDENLSGIDSGKQEVEEIPPGAAKLGSGVAYSQMWRCWFVPWPPDCKNPWEQSHDFSQKGIRHFAWDWPSFSTESPEPGGMPQSPSSQATGCPRKHVKRHSSTQAGNRSQVNSASESKIPLYSGTFGEQKMLNLPWTCLFSQKFNFLQDYILMSCQDRISCRIPLG